MTDPVIGFHQCTNCLQVIGTPDPAPEKIAPPIIFEEKLPFEYEDIENEYIRNQGDDVIP